MSRREYVKCLLLDAAVAVHVIPCSSSSMWGLALPDITFAIRRAVTHVMSSHDHTRPPLCILCFF
jgi:hypothetical protein